MAQDSRAYHVIPPNHRPVLVSSAAGAVHRIYNASGLAGTVKVYDAASIDPKTLARASVLYDGALPLEADKPLEVLMSVFHGIVIESKAKQEILVTWE